MQVSGCRIPFAAVPVHQRSFAGSPYSSRTRGPSGNPASDAGVGNMTLFVPTSSHGPLPVIRVFASVFESEIHAR